MLKLWDISRFPNISLSIYFIIMMSFTRSGHSSSSRSFIRSIRVTRENADLRSADPHYLQIGSEDYLRTTTHTDPLYGPSPQNRIKIINEHFSCRLSNSLLVLAKFQLLHAVCKCNRLAFSGSQAISYHYTLPFSLSWPYRSIWKTGKPPRSL